MFISPSTVYKSQKLSEQHFFITLVNHYLFDSEHGVQTRKSFTLISRQTICNVLRLSEAIATKRPQTDKYIQKDNVITLSLFLCTLFPICCFITFFLFTTKKSLTFFTLNIYQGFTHFNLVTNPFHHYYYYPATFNIILFHSLVSMCFGKKHLSSRTFI